MTPPKQSAVLAPSSATQAPAPPAPSLAERYRAVRGLTERLAAPISPEDAGIQSMPDASPTRWHLAHTTWFFETFVLAAAEPGRRPCSTRTTTPWATRSRARNAV
jgi:hypothetical protein